MNQTRRTPAVDITAIPRAVLSAAAGMVQSVERAVVGESRMRTARDNAWEAVLADRHRASKRAELSQLVATRAQLAVGGQPKPGAQPPARTRASD
jgi:hypothetical protein